MHLQVQLGQSVHLRAYIVTGILHKCGAFVDFTAQYYIKYSGTVSSSQAQDVQSKYKSSSDAAGNTVFFKVLYCKIKNVFFIFCAVSYALFV